MRAFKNMDSGPLTDRSSIMQSRVFDWLLVSRVVSFIQIVTICQLRAFNPYNKIQTTA